MLLETDLARVSALLRSPVRDIVEARGVASVPSPVANTGVARDAFVAAAVKEFASLYGGAVGVAAVGDAEAGAVEGVQSERHELESEEWVYGQTPRFVMQLPTGGELAVDKGVVVEAAAADAVGARFGGDVVAQVLVAGGLADEEARRWADEMVGGHKWRN